ncbi:zinc finger protein jing isoform X2 [Trichogramma pretiosum]|uniref:zinc finger protein jing isoform X2 n=1 Tax=Trichogramma pretiosum TaxID=7493 RepID=UPI000C71A13B|nr:zinc finger protein jing isoform X2 [Trichogramma pretiosum]
MADSSLSSSSSSSSSSCSVALRLNNDNNASAQTTAAASSSSSSCNTTAAASAANNNPSNDLTRAAAVVVAGKSIVVSQNFSSGIKMQQQLQHNRIQDDAKLSIASAVVLVERTDRQLMIKNKVKNMSIASAGSAGSASAGAGGVANNNSVLNSSGGKINNVKKDLVLLKDKLNCSVVIADDLKRMTPKKASGNNNKAKQDVVVDNDDDDSGFGSKPATPPRSETDSNSRSGSSSPVVASPVGVAAAAKKKSERDDCSGSSDSGVASSCHSDCLSRRNSSSSSSGISLSVSGASSSSGSSDITEPGSPCGSTGSIDEGVHSSRSSRSSSSTSWHNQQRSTSNTAKSPRKSSANSNNNNKSTESQQQQQQQQQQWPWTPPLAVTASSNEAYKNKNQKTEPRHGQLPRQPDDSPTTTTGRKTKRQSAIGASSAGVVVLARAQDSSNTASIVIANKKSAQSEEETRKITQFFKAKVKRRRVATKPYYRCVLNKQGGQLAVDKNLKMTIGSEDNESETLVTDTSDNSGNSEKGMLPPSLPTDHLSMEKARVVLVYEMHDLSHPTYYEDAEMDTSLEKLVIDEDYRQDDEGNADKISGDTKKAADASSTSSCSVDTTSSVSSTDLDASTTSMSMDVDQTKLEAARRQEVDDILTPPPSDLNISDESLPDALLMPIECSTPEVDVAKKLRFPPRKSHSPKDENKICSWESCEGAFDSSAKLLEHLQTAHIFSQPMNDRYTCMWTSCKVYGKVSCSRKWLEGHVITHAGNKPFSCIVEGCGAKFASQSMLNKHVNGHFDDNMAQNTSTGKKSTESTAKMMKKNGKKMRLRKTPYSARVTDHFDPAAMECLKYDLIKMDKSRTQGFLAETPGNAITLTSKVIGKRTRKTGESEVLVQWYPRNIESDEWILECDLSTIKHVPIRKAAQENEEELISLLFKSASETSKSEPRARQNRRKPVRFGL